MDNSIEEFIKAHQYIIQLHHVSPRTGMYSIDNFRLKSDSDIERIKAEYFNGENNLTLTYFEGTTNVCLHRIYTIDRKIIENFTFRGVTIQGEGVIFGMGKDGKILEKPSERPLNFWKKRGSNEENIVKMEYNNFRPSRRIDWYDAGENEMRKMDSETDGNWRIENDLD